MKKYFSSYKYDLIIVSLLLVALFSLGVAHVNSIVYASLYGGILLFYVKYYGHISKRDFLEIRVILLLFTLYLLIALISLNFSIYPKETLKEIKSEILQNFVIFISLYLIARHFGRQFINYFIYGIIAIFFVHSFINLPLWVYHDFTPRMGGLLDTPGGEKYAVWLSVAFAFTVSFFLLKNYKYGALFSLILACSMLLNSTRAMYIGLFLVLLFTGLFMQNRQAAVRFYFVFFAIALSVVTFLYLLGDSISHRFDVKGKSERIVKILNLPPAQMGMYAQNTELLSEVSRLSMWKSIYEAMKLDPVTPRGYGRGLYSKTIKEEFSNEPHLIPPDGVLFQFPHNSFLGILYQLGIVGFIILLMLFFMVSKTILIGYRNSFMRVDKLFLAAIFLAIIGFWGNMLFSSFFVDSEARMLYFLIGLALGIATRNRHVHSP